MTSAGFVFGDHTFLAPGQAGSPKRHKQPKRQIKGAPPPECFDGLLRESTAASPAARELAKGKFCGHGEPTMTIFDVVLDGRDEVELATISPQADEDDPFGESAPNPLIAIRPASGGAWRVLFRPEWGITGLHGVVAHELSAEDASRLDDEKHVCRVSIGFEYPCDATSRDDATWLTIDALRPRDKKPICLVDGPIG